MREEAFDALSQPTRQSTILSAPEKAMVHQHGIGMLFNGGIDQGQAGGDAAKQALDLWASLNLQPIGAIVFKLGRCQQVVEVNLDLSRAGHGVRLE